MPPFTILVDKQEKTPFLFKKTDLNIDTDISIKKQSLKTGDYSLLGFENQICIERKSIVDLFGSCGGKQGIRRKRFEEEFKRMCAFEYAALVIEKDWRHIYKNPPQRSKITPKQIMRTLMAWHMRYNVHIWDCPTRLFAENITYLLLDRFYRDKMELEGI